MVPWYRPRWLVPPRLGDYGPLTGAQTALAGWFLPGWATTGPLTGAQTALAACYLPG